MILPVSDLRIKSREFESFAKLSNSYKERSLATICAVALCFHIGVWYTMHIPATGYIACYAYIWIAFYAPHALPTIAPRRVTLYVLAAALYAAVRATLSPTGVLETIGIPFTEEIENSIIIKVGGGMLVWLFADPKSSEK